MFKHGLITSAVFTTLASIALLIGCGGLSQSPLAPQQPAVVQKMNQEGSSRDNSFTIVFSPKASLRATKPTVFKKATGWFSPVWGGC